MLINTYKLCIELASFFRAKLTQTQQLIDCSPRAISRVNFVLVDQFGHPKKCPQKTKSLIVDINMFVCKKEV